MIGKNSHWKRKEEDQLLILYKSLGWGSRKMRTVNHYQLFWGTMKNAEGDRSLEGEQCGSGPSWPLLHWIQREVFTYLLFWQLRTFDCWGGHLTRWFRMSWWGRGGNVYWSDQWCGNFNCLNDYNLSGGTLEGAKPWRRNALPPRTYLSLNDWGCWWCAGCIDS